MLIVSLSTIPSRFGLIGPTLQSLLTQHSKPDAIEVYIPNSYARFPDWDGDLPQVPDGVTIKRCGADLGPATKILPAARAYRGQDVDLLFCDDDRIYDPMWTQVFIATRAHHPKTAIALRGMMVDWKLGGTSVTRKPRAVPRPNWQKWLERMLSHRTEDRLFKKSGYVDMLEGCGGVMVKPDMFDDTDFDIPKVARAVDDVWLSGMLERKGIPIWLTAGLPSPTRSPAHAADPLDDSGRHAQNISAIRHVQNTFGIWHT